MRHSSCIHPPTTSHLPHGHDLTSFLMHPCSHLHRFPDALAQIVICASASLISCRQAQPRTPHDHQSAIELRNYHSMIQLSHAHFISQPLPAWTEHSALLGEAFLLSSLLLRTRPQALASANTLVEPHPLPHLHSLAQPSSPRLCDVGCRSCALRVST